MNINEDEHLSTSVRTNVHGVGTETSDDDHQTGMPGVSHLMTEIDNHLLTSSIGVLVTRISEPSHNMNALVPSFIPSIEVVPDEPSSFVDSSNATSSDYTHRVTLGHLSSSEVRNKVLFDLNNLLSLMGKNLTDYQIVNDDLEFQHQGMIIKEVETEINIVIDPEDLVLTLKLNPEQKHAYDMILDFVFTNKSGSFLIDGPGGTGKTFLYQSLFVVLRLISSVFPDLGLYSNDPYKMINSFLLKMYLYMRCRFNIDLEDDTSKITASVFGELAEKLLTFTGVQAMEHFNQSKATDVKQHFTVIYYCDASEYEINKNEFSLSESATIASHP
ncbi:DNA helicase Pif1-like [Dillenia turbinata]|uniref:ATP-dependent DNA helicase n=1 Tax=Dillenia turbinata TaxID=194707 RepID=A0AAN8VHD3_9MAGN